MGGSFKIVPTKDMANTRVSSRRFTDFRSPGDGRSARRKTPERGR
jgi:hypothetical protein